MWKQKTQYFLQLLKFEEIKFPLFFQFLLRSWDIAVFSFSVDHPQIKNMAISQPLSQNWKDQEHFDFSNLKKWKKWVLYSLQFFPRVWDVFIFSTSCNHLNHLKVKKIMCPQFIQLLLKSWNIAFFSFFVDHVNKVQSKDGFILAPEPKLKT